ncbi:MAG: glycosyltransferase family 2 protein [Armatimonadota bacterium]
MFVEQERAACVSVLIPAFNEHDRVFDTVRGAKSLQGVGEVIVIDDASQDSTSAVASEAGADYVIRLEHNCGKGGALDAGLARAKSPYILMLDADLGSSASMAQPLIDPVMHGDCDMTVAIFPELFRALSQAPLPDAPSKKGGFGLALKLARWGIHRLTGAELIAPLSGQRCLDRRIVESMGGFGRGFGVETAMSGWAAMGGWRVGEIEVQMSHRRTGKDLAGFRHRFRQLIHIARALKWLAGARFRAKQTRG